ncbi:MAG: glycosyltransferase [Gemmatimonadota bacterium]|nr:glycosyltransferase [Gemmatimonadota bacterium]
MVFAHSEIDRIAATGVSTAVIPFRSSIRPDLLVRQILSIRSRIREFRPDIVHAHFGTMTAFATVLAANVPVIITFRGSDLNPSPCDGRIRNAVQNILSNTAAKSAKGVILVSRQLRARLWFDHPNAHVIPTGVDLDAFKPSSRSEAREKLGWSINDPVVLFNAGLSPEVKRLDLAEQAVGLLKQRVPTVRMHVLDGRTPHRELPFYMNAADCLLVTSDFEGSPDIVKEALASNLPIVSVDVGDVRERTSGVSGVEIVARDAQAIASAAERIIGSANRSNGREKIAELDSNRIRDAVIQVYEDILGSHSGNRAPD